MKLFLKPGACSLASHIVLEEIGRPYETETVDLAKKVTASGADFLALNPKGYVPALLLDDGDLLTEGPAILQYLADLAPELNLAPANGSKARYQLQSWLTFIGTEVHKNFSPFFNPAATPEMKSQATANLQRRLGYVNDQLAGRDFLLGQTFSVADAYLFTVVGWAQFIQLDLSAWPNITAFLARVAARPAVQRALKAEGLA
ncbi:MAG: glutathione transferase GstA [Aquabacterium sp.]|jgi:glutathione S-transferase|uniref:glutathione transferase GstA n=1 Tax=Aquabacterium sp. TaxID=1872578 RepID=UPI001B53FF4C|nr:glutathione transferase GstA [Aquabacterium sp.]MBP7133429.1 glutathione transferase GstA [Aquabacterium sp.]MBP9063875.1 glutathione transferase GstA [Aquabacterium sp.]